MPTTIQDASPEGKLPQFEKPIEEKELPADDGTEAEASVEQAVEKPKPEAAAETAGATPAPVTVNLPKAVPTPVPVKDPELVEIETILSEGLESLYKELPDNRKAEFRQKGEETAGAIRVLLSSAKVKVTKIVALIVKWLKMIPGVNKFFLEQESKIKADRLLEFKKDKEEKR